MIRFGKLGVHFRHDLFRESDGSDLRPSCLRLLRHPLPLAPFGLLVSRDETLVLAPPFRAAMDVSVSDAVAAMPE